MDKSSVEVILDYGISSLTKHFFRNLAASTLDFYIQTFS